MTIAALNLQSESWQFVRLTIALLQPALVLLLIAGLVLASAHLLTMIATRWGDRRASSKAMLFSVAVHLLLAVALVTLIPEYRSRVFARLAELDDEPIRILSTPNSSDIPELDGSPSDSPLFDRIPDSDLSPWSRFDAPTGVAADPAALEKSPAGVEVQPELSRDAPLMPSRDAPSPQQESSTERDELAQASPELPLESLETQAREETAVPSASRDRSEVPAMRADPSAPLDRTDRGNVDRSIARTSPDLKAPDLLETPTPQAEIRQREDDSSMQREGPAPASPETELLGQQRNADEASRTGAPVDPQLARSDLRARTPAMETPGLGRMRSKTSPLPEVTPGPSPALSLPRGVPGDQPQVTRLDDPFLRRDDRESVPSAYRLRTEEERERAIQRYGGSPETEAAVDRSLKWLASVQHANGYWDASEYGAGRVGVDQEGVNREFAGRDADSGVTALAVLAFLGKLNTLDQGEYSPAVNKALRWLVAQQTVKQWGDDWGSTDGYLGGNATDIEAMYCHAMATFALAEAYAMSRDNPEAQWLREPLQKAVGFILDVQNPDGGWRYVKGQREGDMSIFGWQLMALKSAEAAGIPVPEPAKARMRGFLWDRRRGEYGGLAGYRVNEPPSSPMTAEALYCRYVLQMARDPQATSEAVTRLLSDPPRRTTLNLYYWYYGTLAMFQHGGDAWEQWNSAMREILLSEQRQTGSLAGSWDPRGPWGGYGGRIYSTAMATLSLEVYYRYLPLYRLNDE